MMKNVKWFPRYFLVLIPLISYSLRYMNCFEFQDFAFHEFSWVTVIITVVATFIINLFPDIWYMKFVPSFKVKRSKLDDQAVSFSIDALKCLSNLDNELDISDTYNNDSGGYKFCVNGVKIYFHIYSNLGKMKFYTDGNSYRKIQLKTEEFYEIHQLIKSKIQEYNDAMEEIRNASSNKKYTQSILKMQEALLEKNPASHTLKVLAASVEENE